MSIALKVGVPQQYLGADPVIESGDPEICALSSELRTVHGSDEEFAKAAFDWVRDNVEHSIDALNPLVTLSSTEVLRERVGLCYAKSHLLVALLRSQGIPSGLCYQRLHNAGGHVLHGLVAVYLYGSWHRLDPRGNRPGVSTTFSLNGEDLAYEIDESLGEVDYPQVLRFPAVNVVHALRGSQDVLVLCDGGLPSELSAESELQG